MHYIILFSSNYIRGVYYDCVKEWAVQSGNAVLCILYSALLGKWSTGKQIFNI